MNDQTFRVVESLLRQWAGASIKIREIVPLDHSVYGQTVSRIFLSEDVGDFGSTLVLKRRREDGTLRSERRTIQTEIATLDLLTHQATRFGPRLVGGDGEAGLVLLEDLGAGPSLEHVLFARDAAHAEAMLTLFATTLAEFHIALSTEETAFKQACRAAGMTDEEIKTQPEWYVHGLDHFSDLRRSVAGVPELPQPDSRVEREFLACRDEIATAGPYRTLVHADSCPANTRIVGDRILLLDFESSRYDHALHNVLNLIRISSCPCWSVLPDAVANRAVEAYRHTFAAHHPGVLNDDAFFRALACLALLEAVGRLRAWTRLDQQDEHHPVGFTKRAQRLETVRAAVEIATRADVAPALTAWLAALRDALEKRWRHTTLTITGFPAFASAQPDLKTGIPLEGIAP